METLYSRACSSQAAWVTDPWLQQGKTLAKWLQAMLQLLPLSSDNDPKPILFSSRDHGICLRILDSRVIYAWVACTLPFSRAIP